MEEVKAMEKAAGQVEAVAPKQAEAMKEDRVLVLFQNMNLISYHHR